MILTSDIESQISSLPGPIVVTGAAGFVGAHLTYVLQGMRDDVYAAIRTPRNIWRIEALGIRNVRASQGDPRLLLDSISPKTIFNLAAHGAYSHQIDQSRILETNLCQLIDITEWAESRGAIFIQAGSSSEYGTNAAAPQEVSARPQPNSLYAVTKLSASLWIEHLSRHGDLNGVTLRLYSVYGPLEDPGRLIPTLIREGIAGRLPPLAHPRISRDFVYVDDVTAAFISAAHSAAGSARGLTINIGTGIETTIEDVAQTAIREFGLIAQPNYGHFSRRWDVDSWYANPALAEEILGWQPLTSFPEGFHRTRNFYMDEREDFLQPRLGLQAVTSQPVSRALVSVVVACYKDGQAIPFMYERVRSALTDAGYDFELILVNDSSPDDTLTVIEELSANDSRVVGITHARNFGSQAAFLSGMKVARGDYVALLDGDLQDPPELLPVMLERLSEGFDVAYGRRVSREASRLMQVAYKGFYRVFSRLSPFDVPRDAGDFSVMKRPVSRAIMNMPERDLFIRAQRAYVGFRQVGVDYVRPERMFGRSTNNLGKNVGWALRGLLSVSRAPLTALSIFGAGVFGLAVILILTQVITRIFWPDLAPKGLATISILILGMGALNILGISVVGEYVGRILDETKRRPRFIRRLETRSGVTRDTQEGD